MKTGGRKTGGMKLLPRSLVRLVPGLMVPRLRRWQRWRWWWQRWQRHLPPPPAWPRCVNCKTLHPPEMCVHVCVCGTARAHTDACNVLGVYCELRI